MFLSLFLTFIVGCQEDQVYSRAYQIESLDQRIGGPSALAEIDDFIIENQHLRFAIVGNRNSSGPHTFGGSIIDADVQRSRASGNNGFGNDQIAELFPTVNMSVALIDQTEGEVVILNDGSNDQPAQICASGKGFPFLALLQPIWGLSTALDENSELPYSIRTDYTLGAESTVLTMTTYLLIGENEGCNEPAERLAEAITAIPADDVLTDDTALIDMIFVSGYLFGDFYLQGGEINVFTPDIGYDEGGHIFDLERQEINTTSYPIAADYLGGTGDEVSYGLIADQSKLYVPLFTSSQTVAIGAGLIPEEKESITRIPDGSIVKYERWFTVGQGDMASVMDAFFDHQNTTSEDSIEVGEITGQVIEEGSGIAITNAHVFVFKSNDDGSPAEYPWLEIKTDAEEEAKKIGYFHAKLPVGSWHLQVHKKGRPTSPMIPITVTTKGVKKLSLLSPPPGRVKYTIRDETNRLLPAKISFFSANGSYQLNPVFGDGFISGQPAAVAFAEKGTGIVTLPPGTYYAVASRGVEYEIDTTEVFEVTAQSMGEIELQVIRAIDTTGWISADLHVHSFPSHDSGVSASEQVTAMACEGVEFFVTTDHDYISNFQPTIEHLNMEEWLLTATGTEVTTIEVGHYIGYPLRNDTLNPDGGAIDWTDLEPQEIIDGIRDLKLPEKEDPLIFVAHPRDGILGYFSQYGLNGYTGEIDALQFDKNILALTPEDDPLTGSLITTVTENTPIAAILDPANFSIDFHALEVINGKRFETIRTPTELELEQYNNDLEALGFNPSAEALFELNSRYAYDINVRTIEEQENLRLGKENGGYGFAEAHHGVIDDWFLLLNLGYRFTAIGNSDTHNLYDKQAGYPRNYVQTSDDKPYFADVDDINKSIKEGRVMVSFGPFIRFYANDANQSTIGDTIIPVNGDVTFTIEVQSPSWIDVGRIELYENGELYEAFDITNSNQERAVVQNVTLQPEKDSWYVVIVNGSPGADISPVATSVFRPVIDLKDVVVRAFADSQAWFIGTLESTGAITPLPPIPRTHPIFPYAFTNPIWVDIEGDGFTPPGLPEWINDPNVAAEE